MILSSRRGGGMRLGLDLNSIDLTELAERNGYVQCPECHLWNLKAEIDAFTDEVKQRFFIAGWEIKCCTALMLRARRWDGII